LAVAVGVANVIVGAVTVMLKFPDVAVSLYWSVTLTLNVKVPASAA